MGAGETPPSFHMVRIKILRTVIDSRYGTLDPGKIILVHPDHARQMIDAGAALELCVTKMVEETVVRGPPVGPLSFATRREKSSSSRLVPLLRTPILDLPESGPSSSSTTPTAFAQARKSSTPVTVRGGNTITKRSNKTSGVTYGRRTKALPPNMR